MLKKPQIVLVVVNCYTSLSHLNLCITYHLKVTLCLTSTMCKVIAAFLASLCHALVAVVLGNRIMAVESTTHTVVQSHCLYEYLWIHRHTKCLTECLLLWLVRIRFSVWSISGYSPVSIRGGLAHRESRKFPGGPLPNYKILKLQITANSFDTKHVTWQCKCKRYALSVLSIIPPVVSNKAPTLAALVADYRRLPQRCSWSPR